MYVLAAPCLLDPSLRAEGITSDEDRAAFARALERCDEFGIEVVPLPCPETLHLGRPRSPGPLQGRLDTPAFEALLDRFEEEVRAVITARGPPLCVVGVDSSPCCGVTRHFVDEARRPGRGTWLARFSDLPAVDVKTFARYRVYLAAPLFSAAEREFNARLASFLLDRHYRVILPQERGDDGAVRDEGALRRLYEQLLFELEGADVVVAVIDGSDADSGTAWEMGYASARGIPVIALRTDFRRVGSHERVNLMLECSSTIAGSFEELTALLEDRAEHEEKEGYQASGKAMLV